MNNDRTSWNTTNNFFHNNQQNTSIPNSTFNNNLISNNTQPQWVVPVNTTISNTPPLQMQQIAMLKNCIAKEGTHTLRQNYERFVFDEETIIDKITKKAKIQFVSVNALEGYNSFSLEELRRIDLIYKKINNQKQSGIISNVNNSLLNNFQVIYINF